MKAAEIRSKFIQYFVENAHTQVDSSSLIPQNDPTLLFTNAGMVQFKDVFTGAETRPYQRATSSQKCVRAGGKHNDLENVGFTARHHTFFEMLGNFSFGDYFKKEAIHFAWDFVTRELQISKDRLYVTVHVDDDEAAKIWNKQEKIPADRISRFDDDNFWAMGDTGPCGPCSEIFVDRGRKYGCGKSDCRVGCDCDRFMEIWNLVFMQFERNAQGETKPLPKPSVDTGAGLERIASVLQNVETNYDIDSFVEIMSRTGKLAGKKYDPQSKGQETFAFRVIADHSRATAFLIADGVLPSNEGRGYVLRRIMRRAIRYGKQLGFEKPFLYQTCSYVIDQMADVYPELQKKRAFIEKAVQAEEEQFFRTLARGLALLDEEIKKISRKTLSGDVAFKLYDTYGFPLDLTRVICAEHGIQVDEAGFQENMQKQRNESRRNWKGSGEETVSQVYQELAESLKTRLPQFTGYDSLQEEAECLAIIEQGKRVNESSSSTLEAVFSRTPFYGESGGQTGDQGQISGSGFEGQVVDVQKPANDLIVARIEQQSGTLEVGKKYRQSVDSSNRAQIARNHTATHLLHWALRETLGTHVQQAGSLVTSELLRFDFTHFQAMTRQEVLLVEDLINQKIWSSDPVKKTEMDKDAAVEAGAIAFFGEKYGDRVRVVQVGDYSTELCGGTHVDRSSDIHLFKIQNESGIASGVRRIVATTSEGAFAYLRSKEQEILNLQQQFKATSPEEIPSKLERLQKSEKDLRKQIEKFQSQAASGEVDQMVRDASTFPKGKVITKLIGFDPKGIKHLREISDQVHQKDPSIVLVLGMIDYDNQKAMLLASKGKKTPKTIQANQIIKDLSPLIDGRGGGKPDLAQAGGSKPDSLEKALVQANEFLSKELSS